MWAFFTRVEADYAADCLENYLRWYSKLASDAIFMNLCAWKLRPKLHYAAHVAIHIRTTRENPRRYDLFPAEDYGGKIKAIAKRCHRLNAKKRVAQRVIWGMCHRMYKVKKGEAPSPSRKRKRQ